MNFDSYYKPKYCHPVSWSNAGLSNIKWYFKTYLIFCRLTVLISRISPGQVVKYIQVNKLNVKRKVRKINKLTFF